MFLEDRDCGLSLFISVPFPDDFCGALPVEMQLYRIDQKHTDGRGNIRAKPPRCKNHGHVQAAGSNSVWPEAFVKRCISFFDMCLSF